MRVHRAGEGAPFTGLKPPGLDVGPVIPAAERALETGSVEELVDVLCAGVRGEVERRLGHAMALKQDAGKGVPQEVNRMARRMTTVLVAGALGVAVMAPGSTGPITAGDLTARLRHQSSAHSSRSSSAERS